MERENTIAYLVFKVLTVLLFAAVVHACATTKAVLGQDAEKAGYNTAKALRGNVVHITGTVNNDSKNGLGFIVGENQNELFIVTANHVVRPMDPGPGQAIAQTAQVEFLHAQGELKVAKIIPVSEEKFDLAVLSVPRPPDFKWQKKAIGKPELEPSDKIWTIDADRSWTVSSEAGTIYKSDPAQITTSGLKVLPGHSGAPLISQSGIIGMIFSDETHGNAYAYPLEVIESRVAEWGKPWDLEDNYSGTNKWWWALAGIAAAVLLSGDDDDDDGQETTTITVSAPEP